MRDPTEGTGTPPANLNELQFDPEDLTTYEKCAIDLSNRKKAEEEVGGLEDETST